MRCAIDARPLIPFTPPAIFSVSRVCSGSSRERGRCCCWEKNAATADCARIDRFSLRYVYYFFPLAIRGSSQHAPHCSCPLARKCFASLIFFPLALSHHTLAQHMPSPLEAHYPSRALSPRIALAFARGSSIPRTSLTHLNLR